MQKTVTNNEKDNTQSEQVVFTDLIEYRKSNLATLTAVLPFVSLFLVVFTLICFLVQGYWQHLAMLGLTLAGGMTSIYAKSRMVRGKTASAVAICFCAIFIFIPLSTFFWKGPSQLYTLSIIVCFNTLAQLIVPKPRRMWVFVLSLAIAALPRLVDALPFLWERYDVSQWLLTSVLLYLMLGSSVLLVLWRIVIAYQSIKTIRLRLSVTLGIGAFLVAVTMGFTSMLVSITNARNQVIDQLTTVAELKEDLVNTWLRNLQLELDTLLVGNYELDRARMLMDETVIQDNRLTAAQILNERFKRFIEYTGRYDEIFIVNPNGKVMLSTDPTSVGRSFTGEYFLTQGMLRNFVSKPVYLPEANHMSLVIARPLRSNNGRVIGVVVARVNMLELAELIGGNDIGQTGVTYIVSDNYKLLSPLISRQAGDTVVSHGIIAAVEQVRSSGTYENDRGVIVYGAYHWLPSLQAALITEVDRVEILRTGLPTILINAGLAVITIFLGVLISLWIAKGLTSRLSELASTAARIAQGESNLTVEITKDDEIGAVANAFNAMTRQLNSLVNELEQRVRERTRGLTAVADVSRIATSELNPDKLIPQVVNLVCEQFNLYYVGLFLVEESKDGRYAVLRAGTGEAGQRMITQGWRLPIGGESMVGLCISTGLLRVKQSAQDTVPRFDNPYLPETKSELALPLRYGPRVIGAMTVQSKDDVAFDETIITLLQNMADQVAIVIENARLFAETQAALDRAQLVQQRYQMQAWHDYIAVKTILGYELTEGHLTQLRSSLIPEVKQAVTAGRVVVGDDGVLTVPIMQSGQVVGALGFEKTDEGSRWDESQIAFVQGLADQLALAADNQRLLDETQKRAAREQLTRVITEQIRSSLDVNTILQTAVNEIGQVMDLNDLVIELHDISLPSTESNL